MGGSPLRVLIFKLDSSRIYENDDCPAPTEKNPLPQMICWEVAQKYDSGVGHNL